METNKDDMARTNCVRCKSFWSTVSIGGIISILSISLINGWITYAINWDELKWLTDGIAKIILTCIILAVPGMVGMFGVIFTMNYCKSNDANATKLELYIGVAFVTFAIILLVWIIPVITQVWQ